MLIQHGTVSYVSLHLPCWECAWLLGVGGVFAISQSSGVRVGSAAWATVRARESYNCQLMSSGGSGCLSEGEDYWLFLLTSVVLLMADFATPADPSQAVAASSAFSVRCAWPRQTRCRTPGSAPRKARAQLPLETSPPEQGRTLPACGHPQRSAATLVALRAAHTAADLCRSGRGPADALRSSCPWLGLLTLCLASGVVGAFGKCRVFGKEETQMST